MDQKGESEIRQQCLSDKSIVINGSQNEGGGQIFRISLALSVIFQKKFTITNIRSTRPNAGINNQLISVIELMQSLVKAEVTGARIGSQDLTFEPLGMVEGGSFNCGGNSAQSTSLMFQCLLPILIFAKNTSLLTLKGGTLVSKSPPNDSIKNCLIPLLNIMGVNLAYTTVREGYFPIGGGIIEVEIIPCSGCLKPIQLKNKTKITSGYIKFIMINPNIISEQFIENIEKIVSDSDNNYFSTNEITYNKIPEKLEEPKVQYKIESKIVKSKKFKQIYGVIVNLFSPPNVYDCSLILMKDLDYEKVVEQTLVRIKQELDQDSCLDEFHQDQVFDCLYNKLLIFMALASGTSEIKVGKVLTDHTNAAIYVLKMFIPDLIVDVHENINGNLIRMQGIGFIQKG